MLNLALKAEPLASDIWWVNAYATINSLRHGIVFFQCHQSISWCHLANARKTDVASVGPNWADIKHRHVNTNSAHVCRVAYTNNAYIIMSRWEGSIHAWRKSLKAIQQYSAACVQLYLANSCARSTLQWYTVQSKHCMSASSWSSCWTLNSRNRVCIRLSSSAFLSRFWRSFVSSNSSLCWSWKQQKWKKEVYIRMRLNILVRNYIFL